MTKPLERTKLRRDIMKRLRAAATIDDSGVRYPYTLYYEAERVLGKRALRKSLARKPR